MKTKSLVFAVMAALLVFSGGALEAKPIDAGNGGGGGGGSDGGGSEPPDYGDLVILYRDASGVPILDNEMCQQPIAFPSDTCTLDCTGAEPCLVPIDPVTCAVVAEFASCTQEVDFGRINSARAPDTVLEAQMEDVIITLATADCIGLGPAGRLVASSVADGVVSTKTIDSPLQNLAIYRQLMLTGFLGDVTKPIVLPAGILDTAARGLGVASDKSGEVNVDLVAYLNQIMGLTDLTTTTILDPKICIDVKEEVMGEVKLVEKCFLDYEAYDYDRIANFASDFGGDEEFLPSPAYIPSDDPQDGWFEYLALIPGSELDPRFQILMGPILDAVFVDGSGNIDSGFLDGNIGGFTQAADDTRAVINFMHNWPVPGDFPTPVSCNADPGLIAYDMLITEESGLQVPKQMVDGGEGREFTVTVANASASTDPASGTVRVTAVAASGGTIDGSPWVFEFTDVVPGASQSWLTFFTIDLGQRTTINWTATVNTPHDVNSLNNTVTATTNVKVTGGGGGGGRP